MTQAKYGKRYRPRTRVKIVNRRRFITRVTSLIISFIMIIYMSCSIIPQMFSVFKRADNQSAQVEPEKIIKNEATQVATITPVEITDWNLKLVNKNISVDSSYVPELAEISDGKMFDKRAISNVKSMINKMLKDGVTDVWVQSSYRSYKKQEELFNNKVEYYKEQGKTQKEAEELAQTIVQRPEMSEHNLALAIDFNTVTNEFEKTDAFKWLQKNAQDYGFILRYPKNKQDITGISYESWHWRYVGKEHAKVIKEKGYCLEEYIEYLKGVQSV